MENLIDKKMKHEVETTSSCSGFRRTLLASERFQRLLMPGIFG